MSLTSRIMLYYLGAAFFALAFLTFIVERVCYRPRARRRSLRIDPAVVERQRQEAIRKKQEEQEELSRVAEIARRLDALEAEEWVLEDRDARRGFTGGHSLQERQGDSTPLSSTTATTHRKTERETIIDEQDREFNESLARDRHKEKVQREKEKQRSSLEKQLSSLLDLIGSEPSPSQSDICHLAIRTPDGGRLQRIFQNETTLQVVHSFVLSHLIMQELAKAEPSSPPPFNLLVSPPRTVFSDLSQTLRQVGLAGKGVLFAETVM